MKCFCNYYTCGGALLTLRTWENHRKLDSQNLTVTSKVGLFDHYIDFSMYRRIPAARSPLYPNARLSILEAIYHVMRDFVFTPNASKQETSNRLDQLKNKFLPENI